jgi:hypothetical protein
MGEVERLLTAASAQIVAIDPEDEDARFCLEQSRSKPSTTSRTPTGGSRRPSRDRPRDRRAD